MYEFIEKLIKTIKDILGDNYSVFSKQVEKKNETVYESIIILDNNVSSNTSPTIYLKDYYKMYEDGATIYHIANLIINCYQEHKNERFDVKSFMDFDIIKDYICYELINTEKNKKLLETIPHRNFLDLSICYYVKANNFMKEDTFAGITIQNKHMTDIWDITEEDLYFYASINTPKLLGQSLKGMKQICDVAGLFYDEDKPDYMYILSNQFRIRGASALLYTSLLTEIAKSYDEHLWLIPSSIHEWLVIIDCDEFDYDEMIETMENINTYDLAPEEVLGTHPYFFNKDTLKISLNKED